MNIPNIITTVRFLFIPLLIYYMGKGDIAASITVFLLAGITDFLDGYIARRYGLTTRRGALMDPLADKLIQFSALVMLTARGILPVYITGIVAVKDILLGIGATVLLKRNIIVTAGWHGKLATIAFYPAIVWAILQLPYANTLVLTAVCLAVFALIKYYINYLRLS